MLNENLKQALRTKTVYGCARLVGDSVLDQVDWVGSIVRSLLRSLSKGWALFKDFHFGWYVIIPIVSSTSALGEAVELLAWSGFAVMALALVTFILLDSILDHDKKGRPLSTGPPVAHDDQHPHRTSAPAPRRARATYEPLRSRWTQAGLKRTGVRRALRSRSTHD